MDTIWPRSWFARKLKVPCPNTAPASEVPTNHVEAHWSWASLEELSRGCPGQRGAVVTEQEAVGSAEEGRGNTSSGPSLAGLLPLSGGT